MADKVIPVRMDESLVNSLDSLVEEGLYLNRTEAVRGAVRSLIRTRARGNGLLTVAKISAALIRERWEDNVLMIILYGSVVSGRMHEESDIDLLIVIREGNTREWRKRFNELIYPLIPEIGRQVSLVVNTRREIQELKKAGDPFTREVIENGIKLYE